MPRHTRRRSSFTASAYLGVSRGAFVCASCRTGMMRRDARVCAECGGVTFEFEADACEDIELDVSGTCEPRIPARTNCSPDVSHDAEGGEVEDVEATCDGEPFPLTDEEESEAIEAIADRAGDAESDADEAAYYAD